MVMTKCLVWSHTPCGSQHQTLGFTSFLLFPSLDDHTLDFRLLLVLVTVKRSSLTCIIYYTTFLFLPSSILFFHHHPMNNTHTHRHTLPFWVAVMRCDAYPLQDVVKETKFATILFGFTCNERFLHLVVNHYCMGEGNE